MNRVPPNFYSQVWLVLGRCHGLQIGGRLVQGSVTREMTSSELKFALLVEKTLNCLPEPSMRQMVVEALSILSFLANLQNSSIGWIIDVDEIIRRAKDIFRVDQEIERIKSSPNGKI